MIYYFVIERCKGSVVKLGGIQELNCVNDDEYKLISDDLSKSKSLAAYASSPESGSIMVYSHDISYLGAFYKGLEFVFGGQMQSLCREIDEFMGYDNE